MSEVLYKRVNGKRVPLSEKDLKQRAEDERRHKEYMEKEAYKDLRRLDYADIGDQLDMIFWDKVNGTSKWLEHVKSVKSKHPKSGV